MAPWKNPRFLVYYKILNVWGSRLNTGTSKFENARYEQGYQTLNENSEWGDSR